MSIHDLFFFPISTRTHHLRWLPNRELDGTPWRWRVSLGALLLMERVFCLNKCTLLYTGVINVKQCKSTVDLTKFPCHIALLCIVPVGNTMTPVIWVVLGVLSDIICNVVIYIPCPEIIWKLSDDRWGHFLTIRLVKSYGLAMLYKFLMYGILWYWFSQIYNTMFTLKYGCVYILNSYTIYRVSIHV